MPTEPFEQEITEETETSHQKSLILSLFSLLLYFNVFLVAAEGRARFNPCFIRPGAPGFFTKADTTGLILPDWYYQAGNYLLASSESIHLHCHLFFVLSLILAHRGDGTGSMESRRIDRTLAKSAKNYIAKGDSMRTAFWVQADYSE